jgi:hypothetical protein
MDLDPDRIVGFRYAAGWIQIPIQVDERAVNDYGIVYNTDPVGLTILAYCDPETYMGPDPDPTFDADDELVFMAKDTGQMCLAGTPDPVHTLPGSRLLIIVTDPLTRDQAFIYLFESDGTLDPAAGIDYVSYDFHLLSGSYLETYNTLQGPNPEDTVAETEYYRMHFSDRWIRDEINIQAGGSSGVDILDRHKNLFAPQNCSRSENTFSNGEGAFFVNKNGSVRAIRSYLGANSGPLTQREHFFYERRHDVATYLRVHPISGVMDFYDYSPDAAGMLYYNDLNTGGVLIDGVPSENIVPGAIVWEMATGAQGTLIYAHSVDTDIPGFAYTSYYLDEAPTPVTQCTGDDFAFGSSGLWIAQAIPNTDPALGAHFRLVASRTAYIEAPGQAVALAEQRYQQAVSPLQATVGVPVSVRDAVPAASPRLAQNHPNPFNPVTTIAFELERAGPARLSIHRLGGQKVVDLVTGWLSAGHHEAIWDGRDARGRPAASGTYLYLLQASGQSQSRRMLLLK